jgi:hypothetical protein
MSIQPELIELPFGTPGKIFRSPMPFGSLDPGGLLIPAYQAAGIRGVLVLAENEQILEKTGFDLLAYYRELGLVVLHFPIPDYAVPKIEAVAAALAALEGRAHAGSTPLCTAMRVLGGRAPCWLAWLSACSTWMPVTQSAGCRNPSPAPSRCESRRISSISSLSIKGKGINILFPSPLGRGIRGEGI